MPIIGNFGGGSSKVDKTLLMEGVAADAKATGEAIEAAKTFVAIYGTTTYEEIAAAYNAGKVVVLAYDDSQLPLYDVFKSDFGVTYTFARSEFGGITRVTYSSMQVSVKTEPYSVQPTLSGTEGQIVGFNSSGEATAQDFPQSDWNENDETAAGYVKNRTHWEENQEIILVDNVTVDTSSSTTATDPFEIELTEGEAYVVEFDGNTYECIAYVPDGYPLTLIGNGGLAGFSGGNEEPFLVGEVETESGGSLFKVSTNGTYTVSIKQISSTIHTIDSKYIPSSIQRTITGTQGQVVGFDESGNAVAQNMPDSYLKHVYQSATLPTNSDWTGIAYGNNMFVAISESGQVVCSNNKLDWMPSILPECEWKDVAYGGGKFVAVGRDKIAYSTDGIDWVEVTSQAISQMEYPYYYSIGYGNDKYIIFEQNETRIAYSENGIDWSITESLYDSPIGTDVFTAIVYGEDKFVSVSNSSGSIYFSEDGLNWNKAEGTPSAYLMDIVYGNGKFVTIGHSYISEDVVVSYSDDGINWSDVAIYLDDNYQSVTFWSISYGNGKFVVIGSGSQLDEIGMATEIIIFAYSVNGVDWTIDSIPFVEEDGMHLVYNNMTYGGDKFVAVPTYGTRALFSTDGISWYTEYNELEQNGDIVTENVKKIFNECLPVGNPGDFVVIGDDGTVTTDDVISIEHGGTDATTAEQARKNLGATATVELTQAEYDALESYDENTLYVITDGEGEVTASAEEVQVTLPTSWTNGKVTVNVEGVTGDPNQPIVVDMNLTGTDKDADIAVMEAWGCVNRAYPGVGTITFECYDATPTVAIPLNVVVM